MKKIILSIVLIWMTNMIYSQEGVTRFGLQLSPTLSWMTSDDNLINSNGPKLGIKLGGTGEHYLKDWLILTGAFGFGFSQGGTLLHKIGGNLLPKSDLSERIFNTGDKPLPDDVEITYSLLLFEIEAGIKFLIPWSSKDFDIFFTLPFLNLGLINKPKGTILGTGVRLSSEEIGKDVNPFNFSWGFGGGIQKPTVSGQDLLMGLYFQKGILDITRDDGTKAETLPTGSFKKTSEDSKGSLNVLIFRFSLLF